MDIKNFLYQKKEYKKKQIWIGILTLISLGLISIIIYIIHKNNHQLTYITGDSIQFLGKISYDNNYPINTHKIFDTKTSFGLKDSSINLNNFINKTVLINGTISNTSHKFPILDIIDIKIPESKLIIHENKYFFVNELIMLDFSKDLDLSVEKSGKNINIYHYDEPILSIETFICSKIASTQDCGNMLNNLSQSLNEVFTSYRGYIFYKNKNTSWLTFNEDTLGYIFKTKNNDLLLDMSHLINIVDSSFVLKHQNDLIIKNCNTNGQILAQITKHNLEIIDENLIAMHIKGLNHLKQEINCKLTIDIRNDRAIKSSQIRN